MRSGTLRRGSPAAASRSRTAVIAAMGEELAPLVRRTRVERRWTAGRCRALVGRLAGAPVVLARTGEGARNAVDGTRSLLNALPVDRMLVVGVAGALSPELQPGAILVSRTVVERDRPGPLPDPDWLAAALRQRTARAGSVVTAPTILVTARDKAAAWRALPCDEPAVVDLESAGLARLAGERGLPFLVVRVVSDGAGESLPFDLNVFRDEDGAIRRGAVAWHAMAHPHLIPPLWRLRRRVSSGSESLARFVIALLEGEER